MTWIIVKREIRNYLKNPVFYVGAIVVAVLLYQQMLPYLNIHYFSNDNEIKQVEEDFGDKEIMNGYIPATKEEQYKMGFEKIKEELLLYFGMSKEAAEQVISEISSKNLTILEIDNYMKEHYSYLGAHFNFLESQLKLVNAAEANQYMKDRLQNKTFTYYFSRKYADFLGLFMIFYGVVLLAFLFIRDMKKDTYELLHTKPIKPVQYISGKIAGGMLAMLLVVVVITIIFDVIVVSNGIKAGFPVNILDFWKAVICYVIPNLFMVACVYGCVALLFKNPLPAVPTLLLYIVYSNMGSIGPDGSYDYYGRFLSILVRFPDLFFETTPPPMALFNQLALIMVAVVLLVFSIFLWKRRRFF